MGRSVARNNLFKAAIFGNDPNWGRVLAAAGTVAAAFDPDHVDVAFNGVEVFVDGQSVARQQIRVNEPLIIGDVWFHQSFFGIGADLLVTEGAQVVVGDVASGQADEVAYEVLCRLHWRQQVTKADAMVTLNPEPLPYADADPLPLDG